MYSSKSQNERIAKMTLASVCPHYVSKVEKKGRTTVELLAVLVWLTGLSKKTIDEALTDQWTFQELFDCAILPENSLMIKGFICGYKIEEITNPLVKQLRMLDKLVDELAKGKKLDQVLRKG